jgi:hypothetical protein
VNARLRRFALLSALLCVVLTGPPLTARATEKDAGTSAKTSTTPVPDNLVGRVDLAVPESPALTVLGLSLTHVIRPSNAKDLAASVLYGLDPRGNVQSGIAVDTRPYMLARGSSLTLADYRNHRGKRALARIGVSFATAKGSSDEDRSTRFSLGVRWTPFDRGDFRRDTALDECYRTALTFEDDEATVRLKKCLREAEARNWNKLVWEIGIAGHNVSATGVQDDGMSFWTSVGLPASRFGNVILHLRAYEHLLVADPIDPTGYGLQDGRTAGARFRLGGPKGALVVEGSYVEQTPEGGEEDRFNTASLGLEFRVAPTFWLQFAVGGTFGSDRVPGDSVLSAQFRWGIGKERLFKP